MKGHIGYRDNESFEYPLELLKKHCFAFGGSGSGKSVLSKVFVEEAALNGVPSIIVDPQGDLASLALEPEKETQEAFHSKVAVDIFTPASSKGIPLSANPLAFSFSDTDEDDIIPVINEVALSITKLIGYNPQNDKGRSAATVIYTILKHYHEQGLTIDSFHHLASIVEEPGEQLQHSITPFLAEKKAQEELVRHIRYLTIGQMELMFEYGIPIDIDLLLGKRRTDGKTQISVLYLNSLRTAQEKEFFLTIVASKLYQWMLEHPSEALQALFYIDEVAPYIPAGSEKPMPKPILSMLFKQARKYGVGLQVATQNPGDIDYKAFAQFGTWAMGRLTTQQDQKKVANAFKSLPDFASRLSSLSPGSFLFFCPDIAEDIFEITVRWLYSRHKTLTVADVKKIISKDTRDYYERFMKQAQSASSRQQEPRERQAEEATPTGAETGDTWEQPSSTPEGTAERREDTGSSRHRIALRYTPEDIPRIARWHVRRFLGLPREDIGSFELTYHPVHHLQLSLQKKGFFGRKPRTYTLLFDGVSGNPLRFAAHRFTLYINFAPLLELGYNELRLLQYLTQRSTPLPTGELAARLNLSQKNVQKLTRNLYKQQLVSYTREAGHNLWFGNHDSQELPTRIKVLNSSTVKTESASGVTAARERISLQDCKHLIEGWFPGAFTLHATSLLLPVYHITFLSKRGGSRTAWIDGYTGKNINTFPG